MTDRKWNLGDRVIFRDEFGKKQTGTVVNLEPAGEASNGLGIKPDSKSAYGSYIRADNEVQKEIEK